MSGGEATALMPGPKMQAAIEELEALIVARYPEAAFRVSRSPEEEDAIYLKAIVDVDETDDVIDLIIDRMMELQIQDELPIFVVPVRTPERSRAMIAASHVVKSA